MLPLTFDLVNPLLRGGSSKLVLSGLANSCVGNFSLIRLRNGQDTLVKGSALRSPLYHGRPRFRCYQNRARMQRFHFLEDSLERKADSPIYWRGVRWSCLSNGKAARDCKRYILGCELRIRGGHARSAGARTGSTCPAAESSSGPARPFWVRCAL